MPLSMSTGWRKYVSQGVHKYANTERNESSESSLDGCVEFIGFTFLEI